MSFDTKLVGLQGKLALAEQVKPKKQQDQSVAVSDEPTSPGVPLNPPGGGNPPPLPPSSPIPPMGPMPSPEPPTIVLPPFPPFESNGEKPLSIDTIFNSPTQTVTNISGTGEGTYTGDAKANIVIDNSNGSTVVVNTGAGDDVVVANGTDNFNVIKTGSGNDTVDINGINNQGLIMTESGNDTVNVSGDLNNQTVLTGSGDDQVIASSDTFGNDLAIDGGEKDETNGDKFILDGYEMDDITSFSYNSETGVAYLQDKNGNNYEIRNFEQISLRQTTTMGTTDQDGNVTSVDVAVQRDFTFDQFQQAWWDSLPPIFPPEPPVIPGPIDGEGIGSSPMAGGGDLKKLLAAIGVKP